ncbi:MAG TPA: DNA polymerase III subunit epsilon [Gammaproteobacteria bacterium]|nr:DNA polymerase III subunit epsilon [Gammaproteobacteria bacterium]
MRQIVLDTETTGLEPAEGHRIIEIGCVEIVNRRLTGDDRRWYLNPDRDIDEGAVEVHGITSDFLADKPRFRDIVDEFLEYIRGAELVIHNAPFDVGFLNHELEVHLGRSERVDVICGVLDTLQMARRMYPGQRASLDALCKRFEIDNSRREYHGALLDAQLLAEVYLAMTGGQAALLLDAAKQPGAAAARAEQRIAREGLVLPVIAPKESEALLHARFLDAMREQGATPLWQELEPSEV